MEIDTANSDDKFPIYQVYRNREFYIGGREGFGNGEVRSYSPALSSTPAAFAGPAGLNCFCKVWPQPRTEDQTVRGMQVANHLGFEKNIIYASSRISRNVLAPG